MASRTRARDERAVARFIERLALSLYESGVPRMPSRVFAAILVSDTGRLTAAEWAERLGVSPAAVSGAVRYLVQVSLVVREREPGERRDHYRLLDDNWYHSMLQREKLLARWEREMADGIDIVGRDTPAGRRLETTRRFFAFLDGELPKLLDRWNKSLSAERVARPRSRQPQPRRAPG
jgi:DNA-binding transcriptional regulator GbsR (MarR family)